MTNSLLPLSNDLEQHIDQFIKSRDNVSPRTIEEYKKNIQYFLYWYKTSNQSFSPEILKIYRDYLKDKQLSIYTINSYLNSIQRFCHYLFSLGLLPVKLEAKKLKTPQGYFKEPLSATEAKLLLETILESNEPELIKIRDYAIVNLMIRTGLRMISIQNADIADIKNKNGELVLYYLGKGRDSKDDFVVLTQKAVKPIYDYLAMSKHKGVLFKSIGNRGKKSERISLRNIALIITKYLKKAGIQNKSPHSLRHTAGQLALNSGASVIQVRDMMSHRSIESTMKYVRNTDRLKNSAEKLIDL